MDNRDNLSPPVRSAILQKSSRRERMTSRDIFFFSFACFSASFFTAIIESCFFFSFRPFGFAPDICLALTVASGIKFGPKCGGIMGLLAGFFTDAFSSSGFSLAIIFYMLMGTVMGLLSNSETETAAHPTLLFLIGMVGGASVSGLASLLKICVSHTSVMITDVIFGTLFPEFLITVIFSFAVYFPVALVSRYLRKKQGLPPK